MSSGSFSLPRHWWGKIIGGVLGLFRGGLSGAIIGLLLGHFFDRFMMSIGSVGRTQKAFFDALFSSLGHLSKADGQVTDTEIRMVETLMARMQISGDERQQAIRQFNLGKAPGFDLEAALRPFAQMSALRHDLRHMFMEILVDAAFSSGQVTPEEQAVLLKVARELRIPGELFSAMLNARGRPGAQGQAGQQGYQGYRGQRQRAGGNTVSSIGQAYATLGLTEKASDSEIKRAYRKLVSQYHPDKLVSRGLPEEMMEIAKTRVRDINTAYDQVKQARGFK
jgi:DnaJ like chaperone protein